MTALTQYNSSVAMADGTEQFATIFDQYWLRSFHFALQMVGNREDAMDVAQEAFLRLHRNWHRRDPDRPFAPWFFQIVRNLSIDLLRKRGSLKEAPAEAAPETDVRPNPQVLAEKSQLKKQVWDAINHLPEAQREVIILRDIQGFSYREIAEINGSSVTTVNSRLHDARQALRRKLGRLL